MKVQGKGDILIKPLKKSAQQTLYSTYIINLIIFSYMVSTPAVEFP
jgi:hypothetical protein